jgi:enoyl-CoA hydratase/carnithine racemase
VQGKAVGAGADLVAACDYRLVAPEASLSFPGFRLAGVSLGNRRLAELVGAQRAFDIVLRNLQVDGAQALAWGLATQLARPGEDDAFVAELQRQLGPVAKESIAVLREATRAGADGSRDLERIVQSAAITRGRQA